MSTDGQRSRQDHDCDSGDFDRTACPYPCDTMHSYCTVCGKRQDDCALALVLRGVREEVGKGVGA